jgi:hypothetical protein
MNCSLCNEPFTFRDKARRVSERKYAHLECVLRLRERLTELLPGPRGLRPVNSSWSKGRRSYD